MDEAKYENAMQIILHAGNARSAALMAIDDAAEGDFSAAGALTNTSCSAERARARVTMPSAK